MTPLLSEALQEAYASATTEDVVVDTLEIVAGAQHLYLCRGFTPITLKLEDGSSHVFQPIPFEFNLPGQDSTGAQTLNVGVENVDGSVASFVQGALLSNTPIYVKYRSYLPNRMITPVFSGSSTILGATYATAVMPDGREWMIQDLAATGSGMSTQSTAYGQRYKPDAAFLAVMATLTDGWHLPTSSEWDAMGAAVNPARGGIGELTEAGGDLKALSGWNAPNTGAGLNVGGFSLQPNKTAGTVGWWWTATLAAPTSRRNVEVFHDGRGLAFAGNGTDNYAAVRLVRDYTPPAPYPDLHPQNPRPLVLTVTAAELTLKGVTFSASVADFVNQPFPNAFYSFTSFPGLR